MRYGLRQFGGIGIQRKDLPQYRAGGCRTFGGKKYKERRRHRRVRGRGKAAPVRKTINLICNPLSWFM